MTIYIENAIIDNMAINTMLLWFVFRTIKSPAPKWRIFFAAAFGTAWALAMPLLTFSGAGAVAVRLFIGATMCYICHGKSLARFLLFYLLFLTYTFAFGGAIFGILFMLNSTQESLTFFHYNTSVPVGVFVVGIFLFAYIMNLLIKYLNIRHSVNNLLRDVVIHYDNEKFKITSYLDTGNRLIDPKSKAPVVIITMSLFLKMFPDVSVDRIFMNKLCKENINDGHYINFTTVGEDGNMFVFAPDQIEIMDGKKKISSHDNVRLGVSMRAFKDAIKYDALLNAHLGG